jgi:AcrR family transcriptional regulator
MLRDREETRSRILEAARVVLGGDAGSSMAVVARAARVSRATVHRHFRTRADLLAALLLEPDPDTRARVLVAAADLIGRDGLAALSMDELAAEAGVSRASVYRLFPGKAALVEALMNAYTPWADHRPAGGDRGPAARPGAAEIYRSAARIAVVNLGILRAIFFAITSGAPDAVEGAAQAVQGLIRALGGYLERQMAAGRIGRCTTLAVQSFLGPLFFYLLTPVRGPSRRPRRAVRRCGRGAHRGNPRGPPDVAARRRTNQGEVTRMAAPIPLDAATPAERIYARRWLTLGVLGLSMVIIGIDNFVLNVALPTLQQSFNASAAQLQWMVDAYIVVFAGLLLTMGAVGDRFGRARLLQVGLLVFGFASILATWVTNADQLIAARAGMGFGAAMILPSTLSILINVFPREERGRAIAAWAGLMGLGIGLGPSPAAS